MASAVLLRRLQLRATQADELLAVMRTRVNALRHTAVVQLHADETTKLSAENENLRSDISKLKEQLKDAEVQNGVVQVAMPSPDKKGQAAVVTAEIPSPAAVQTGKASNECSPVQPAGEKKQTVKKETKPKKVAPPAVDVPVDVSRLDMRVGLIVDVKKHPDADALYIEEVDVGEEKTRTIISGLVKHVTLDEMTNRRAIFLCNLKPAKMRGIMSHGMIMCASTPDKVEVISPPSDANIGDAVKVPEFPGEPDALLNPKKKIWEQVKPDLRINADGEATYRGALWRVAGHDGSCRSATLTDSPIS